MRGHRSGHHESMDETLALLAQGRSTQAAFLQNTVQAGGVGPINEYLGVAGSSTLTILFPIIGAPTQVALAVHVKFNNQTVPLTFAIAKNGVDQAVSLVVPAGATGRFDASGAIAFDPGDQWDVHVTSPATTAVPSTTTTAEVLFVK